MKVLSIERIREENPFLTGKIIISEVRLRSVKNFKLFPGNITREIKITCTDNCCCAKYLWNKDSKFWDLVVNN